MDDKPRVELDDQLRARANAPELWLLRLQRLTRLPPLAFGVAAGLLTFLLVALPIILVYGWQEATRQMLDGAVFFGLTIGILAGFSAPVYRGAQQDIQALGAVIPYRNDDRQRLAECLTRETTPRALRMAALGIAAGLLHCWMMGTQYLPLAYAVSQLTGTLLVWLMMWTTISTLINNASIFATLGGQSTPDLLRPTRHAAFGRAALRPALFIIALLCVYPVLALGGALSGGSLIGMAATMVSLFILFFPPLVGIRRRIREVRSATLAELDHRIDDLYTDRIASADAERLFELDAVLDIRERVARASAWPLDLDGVRRILLYVVLPPLTWAAAALVEMLIDSLV